MKNNKDKSLEKYNKDNAEMTREGPVFTPATDIYENGDAILVRCDMPGVDEKQVDITLDHYELTITGSQTAEQPEGYDLLTGEYEVGTFRRSFKVPQLIDRENIKARLRNGVLDVELPKTEQAKPRRIEISTEG